MPWYHCGFGLAIFNPKKSAKMNLLLKLISIIWANREVLIAAIPVVIKAQQEYKVNANKKEWAVQQMEALKQFTPDNIDRAIEVAVQLLQLGGLLK